MTMTAVEPILLTLCRSFRYVISMDPRENAKRAVTLKFLSTDC